MRDWLRRASVWEMVIFFCVLRLIWAIFFSTSATVMSTIALIFLLSVMWTASSCAKLVEIMTEANERVKRGR